MSKRKFKILIFAAVAVVILSLLVFYRIRENLLASGQKSAPVPTVELKPVSRGDISNRLTFSGDLIPIQQVNVYSKVTGNIERLYADIGDYVTRGKLLAVIDKSQYLQSVKQFEGLYNQAVAVADNNKILFDKNKMLFDKGLLPQIDLDNIQTTLKVSLAQVETAKANLENARLQLSYCNITAPFSGYITKRLLDAGALVSQSSTTAIFILSDIGKLKIMINVLERDVPAVSFIKEVRVVADAYPKDTINANIKTLSQSVDISTRTMPVQVDIDNSDRTLKPGMFVRVDMILEQHDNALLIPVQCVQKDEKGAFIFKVDGEMTAHKVYVSLGIRANNLYEILTGLEDEEKVVTSGQDFIKDGIKVKIKN